jgi:hypothetical protein
MSHNQNFYKYAFIFICVVLPCVNPDNSVRPKHVTVLIINIGLSVL